MKIKVTEQGLLIPKEFLRGIEIVDVLKEENRIIIFPIIENDPIFEFGKHPVNCGIKEASESHDKYLYKSKP